MTNRTAVVAVVSALVLAAAVAVAVHADASSGAPLFDEGLTSAVELHAAVDAHLDAAMQAEAEAEADADTEVDADAEAEVDLSAEMEAHAGAGFPISRFEANLTTNCMDVSTAICLGNSSVTGRKGLFAIGRDAHPLGLIGHWTFDDAAAQDHTGNMDALYPRPKFGPGLNGGASAYFNGTALHWLSPARTRGAHPGRVSQSERDLRTGKMDAAIKAAGKRPAAPAPKKGKKAKKQKKQKKLSRSTKAALALARTKAGGGVGAGNPGPHAGPGGAEDLTVSFWVYLLGDVVGKFRTLVYRGDRDGATPHISLWPEIRRIHLRASTGYDPVTHAKTHITLDSHSAVVIGRWTHIAFVVQGTRLVQLYVNGVLDTQKLSLQPVRIHHASDIMYLANSPFAPHSGVRCYMDSVQLFSRALTRGQVTAIGSLGFPGLDAASVKLGCASCSLAAAQRACRKPNHLCTQTELNSGALTVARSMGWLSNLVSVHVFSGEELAQHAAANTKHKPVQVVAGSAAAAAMEAEPVSAIAALGAGLCCRDT